MGSRHLLHPPEEEGAGEDADERASPVRPSGEDAQREDPGQSSAQEAQNPQEEIPERADVKGGHQQCRGSPEDPEEGPWPLVAKRALSARLDILSIY